MSFVKYPMVRVLWTICLKVYLGLELIITNLVSSPLAECQGRSPMELRLPTLQLSNACPYHPPDAWLPWSAPGGSSVTRDFPREFHRIANGVLTLCCLIRILSLGFESLVDRHLLDAAGNAIKLEEGSTGSTDLLDRLGLRFQLHDGSTYGRKSHQVETHHTFHFTKHPGDNQTNGTTFGNADLVYSNCQTPATSFVPVV